MTRAQASIRAGAPPRSLPKETTVSPQAWQARAALYALTSLAVALPFCNAYQLPPQPAFISQLVSLGLWLLVLGVLLSLRAPARRRSDAEKAAITMWCALLLGVAFSLLTERTPLFVATPSIAVLLLAGAITLSAARVPQAWRSGWWRALCVGIALAALYNGAVALLQTVAPHWHDDLFIAAAGTERAHGNLRQPNQLATLVLWGMLAGVALFRTQRLLMAVCTAFALLVLWLSGSRTAWFGALIAFAAAIFALWPAPVRSHVRTRLIAALLAIIVCVAVLAIVTLLLNEQTRNHPFESMQQRISLWRDVIALIKTEPWLGVGFGQLNFAWTLTPFSQRAPDVFDHAHSLPLQLAVELGLPIAFAVLALLVAAVTLALRGGGHGNDADRAPRYLQLGMLGIIFVHSLVEYPLWFAYFLLPSALLLSLLTQHSGRDKPASTAARPASTSYRGIAIAVLVTGCGAAAMIWAARGYVSITKIYDSANDSARAKVWATHARSHPIYGYFGDYAMIMLARDEATINLFTRPARAIIDERLLVAWARAYTRAGEHARAAYVTARARELPWQPEYEKLPPTLLMPNTNASAPLRPADFR